MARDSSLIQAQWRPTDWLPRLVSDEISPFLLAHTQDALQALERWCCKRVEENRKRRESEADLAKCQSKLSAKHLKWEEKQQKLESRKKKRRPIPPKRANRQWSESYWPNRESPDRVYGWVPITQAEQPAYINPLQDLISPYEPWCEDALDGEFTDPDARLRDGLAPEYNRDDCFVVLLAINDVVLPRRQLASFPSDNDLPSIEQCCFLGVCALVPRLAEKHLPGLTRIMQGAGCRAQAASSVNIGGSKPVPANGEIRDDQIWIDGKPYRLTSMFRRLLSFAMLATTPPTWQDVCTEMAWEKRQATVHTRIREANQRIKSDLKHARRRPLLYMQGCLRVRYLDNG